MMKKIIWYAHYLDDYNRDCSDLSLIEHGAYRRLLDMYYATGEPLTSDKKKLYRMIGAVSRAERAATDKILEKYFFLSQTLQKYCQSKCDLEISKMSTQSERNSLNSKKRWDATPHANVMQDDMRNSCYTQSHTQSHADISNKDIIVGSDFLEFWKIYPKQRAGSKTKALHAYTKALKRATKEEIFNGLEKYRRSSEVSGGFAKGCAAWLNDDRWTTDYTPASGRKSNAGEVSKTKLAMEGKL
jgi:uncharacterized protein YdaU (DUF1376 family)